MYLDHLNVRFNNRDDLEVENKSRKRSGHINVEMGRCLLQ